MSERRRWMLRSILMNGAIRFRDASAALPARVWKRWLATLGIGYAGVFLLMFGLVHAGQALAANDGLDWEASFLRTLEASLPLSFSSAVWIQTIGTDLMLLLLVGLASGLAAWNRQPIPALSIIAAYVGLDIVVRVAWLTWNRARPTVILHGIAAPPFGSFPSGHTAKSVAVYGFLAFLWARSTPSRGERLFAASLATVAVILVAAGRLRMGVHWPSDILASLLIGTAWLAVLAFAYGVARRAGDEDAGTAAL